MEGAGLVSLARWGNFFVITGSAAAALTGLQFVVIVLGAQLNRGTVEANRAFGTPTVVHFSTVLLIASLLSAPWPSLVQVGFVLGVCGAAGLVYAAVILQAARSQTGYQLVLEDWVWHFSLPPLAYAALLVAGIGITVRGNPMDAFFVVGGAVLLLLFVGIHNAWDAVTFMALHLGRQREERDDIK